MVWCLFKYRCEAEFTCGSPELSFPALHTCPSLLSRIAALLKELPTSPVATLQFQHSVFVPQVFLLNNTLCCEQDVNKSLLIPVWELTTEWSHSSTRGQLGEPVSLLRLLTRGWMTQRQIHHRKPSTAWRCPLHDMKVESPLHSSPYCLWNL